MAFQKEENKCAKILRYAWETVISLLRLGEVHVSLKSQKKGRS